ncbi:type II toxin-antitoxin system CcdA family antitoxin [Azospirillum sp. TSO35-2]|uniref:type II toxin-antitoxin system CcdA family antitoxin n=1 Tax=Azospirillum sp. TSO35-2 TaxID=716796 RepID=UPI000D65B995|nr:type II toxin-antitoxin system CcdA family antitoxin [Azospirillum sp. TSO35-2]
MANRSAGKNGAAASRHSGRHGQAKTTEAEKQRWIEENREAMKAYDEYVEKSGVFGDGLRLF